MEENTENLLKLVSDSAWGSCTNKVSKLYILARTDIESMNAGKLAAQSSHAATQFFEPCFHFP